jgi:hypothetical protein
MSVDIWEYLHVKVSVPGGGNPATLIDLVIRTTKTISKPVVNLVRILPLGWHPKKSYVVGGQIFVLSDSPAIFCRCLDDTPYAGAGCEVGIVIWRFESPYDAAAYLIVLE